ncbi:MAG: hypothetical protein DWH82_07475 [Planctomycetota bacterium]|nr:MAG: hypothetical protein DWH82_07475 [Planctomycetota bacterium]
MIALDLFWTTQRRGRGRDASNWTHTLGGEQFQWLEKTLASSQAKYKWVFIHHLVGGLDESAWGGAEPLPRMNGAAKARTAAMNSKTNDLVDAHPPAPGEKWRAGRLSRS